MKRVLIAAAALAALAGAAAAQPAYQTSEGAPPSSYPPCTHPHEDRCMQHGGWSHWGHHHHMAKPEHQHSSTDGERG